MSRNISVLKILKVPIEPESATTLWFPNRTEQTSYFNTKVRFSDSDFSYIRREGKIRYNRDYDDLIGCNYLMYQNKAYSDRWYYGFITKIEYVNDGCSFIYFELDVIQTWMFDYNVEKSFIEREHVSDDGIGVHTVDEGLPIGEYMINATYKDPKLYPSDNVVIASTYFPEASEERVGGIYGDLYSGIKYYKYRKGDEVTEALQSITDNSGQEAVSSIFLAPEFLIESLNDSHMISNSYQPKMYNIDIAKNRDIDGYTPKNNKMYCYPYNYLLVSNGNGGEALYKYELFSQNICHFQIAGVLCPSCSIRMIPLDYKGGQAPENEGLNLGKYPQCNWATDIYTNWMTQNGLSMSMSILSSAGSGAMVGALAGSPTPVTAVAGAVIGAVASVGTAYQSIRNADMSPPQAKGNTNCGDVVTAMNNNTFTFYKMSIKREYARMIDGYFDMFGYKVNRFKVPNSNHRQNYWFIKTINANITGDIPSDDMKKIIERYNKGITFWRANNTFMDYTVSNNTI